LLPAAIVLGRISQKTFCGFTPAVSKPELDAMQATIKGLKLRKRTEVRLDDIARELNPMVRAWIAYYGQYTRSAVYPFARYAGATRLHQSLQYRRALFLAAAQPLSSGR
jgi:hypothetical protein